MRFAGFEWEQDWNGDLITSHMFPSAEDADEAAEKIREVAPGPVKVRWIDVGFTQQLWVCIIENKYRAAIEQYVAQDGN